MDLAGRYGLNWDIYGGARASGSAGTYADVLACDLARRATSAFVVSDSGYVWSPDGIVDYIDNLQYDATTISRLVGTCRS